MAAINTPDQIKQPGITETVVIQAVKRQTVPVTYITGTAAHMALSGSLHVFPRPGRSLPRSTGYVFFVLPFFTPAVCNQDYPCLPVLPVFLAAMASSIKTDTLSGRPSTDFPMFLWGNETFEIERTPKK